MKPCIKTLRESAGLTQADLAAKTGYSVSAIQKFESKRRTIPRRSLPIFLTALEVAK